MLPWVTPKDLSELGQKHLRSITPTKERITRKRRLRRVAPSQDVACAALFCSASNSRAPIGLSSHQHATTVCTNQGFKSLVHFAFSTMVSPDFLFWWLKALRRSKSTMTVLWTEERKFKEVLNKAKIVEGLFKFPYRTLVRAEADCGDSGCGGRLAGQAPRGPRPARHPPPIYLPRHVRRSRHQSDGVEGIRGGKGLPPCSGQLTSS